jgi:hypothetical protein
MGKPIINAEEFMKFFEKNTGVQFIDVATGEPAIKVVAKKKSQRKSDYDIWLEEQDENVKSEQEMGSI